MIDILIGVYMTVVVALYGHDIPQYDDVLGKQLTEEQCQVLNLYHEASGEPDEGIFAIIAVVNNRVESPRYKKDTACEVILGTKWFSWTFDGKSDKVTNYDEYHRLWIIYQMAKHDPSLLDKYGEVDHYHASWMKEYPYWSKDPRYEYQYTIGLHMFYIWR